MRHYSKRDDRKRTNAWVRRLSMESLERRDVMAGNVTAVLAGGNLTLTGDSAANQILVDRNPSNFGQLRISPLGTTKINGGTTPVSYPVNGNLNINLNGGADDVRVDRVRLGAALNIDTNGGNDTVLLTNSGANQLHVTTGGGDDNVTIDGFSVGGGPGSPGASISTGDGFDTVQITGLTAGRPVSIDTGNAGDSVSIRSSSFAALSVATDGGNDTVSLSRVTVSNTLQVLAGDGDDLLSVSDSSADFAKFFGGPGTDRSQLFGSSRFGSLTKSGFESGPLS